MAFNSSPYLILLIVAVAVYWLLPVGARRIFVFLASLAFYASWGIVFVWLPLFVAVIVYACGKQMQAEPGSGKRWAWLGITCLLALLAIFKYRGFLWGNLAMLTGWPEASSRSLATSFAFPMGISFYTFEAIGYLIDVRQGRVKMPPFLDLCLFFFFWPNILSGPMVRARELVPQLGFHKAFEARFIFEGADRVIWGLVQKTVIANVLGVWVDRGFAPGLHSRPSTLDGWFLAIAFGLQIYFDFAGYTNMAIGTARLLGVTLPENFRQPYHAATPPEFWARWHMTLSRWIRDYLFFPINAKWQGAPLPLYLSLMGVMGLVGLWHGAGWTFILWGLMHGTYLVLYRMYEAWRNLRPGVAETRAIAAVWRVGTLGAVLAAWVVFRATDLSQAGRVLSVMFYRFAVGSNYPALFYAYTVVIAVVCAVEPVVLKRLGEIEERAEAEGLSPFRVMARPIAYLFGLLLFLLFDVNNAQFIYSQF
ncbi:MAG TPA: MBOAT family O-acyltransferase [Candidatus Sulfotelmatobacter sp.]|nr:MBOAT family O-acyltransferase [Candidatus Sulfotelmatobacter sp.]